MSAPIDASSIALADATRSWTFEQIEDETLALTCLLQMQGTKVLATLLDNSAAWVIADRAASRAPVVHVPLPVFFTAEQIAHAIGAAGVDTLVTSPAFAARWPQLPSSPCTVAGEPLVVLRLPRQAIRMPAGTAKITFTSGTTGAPKGVCLGTTALHAVAGGLVTAMAPLDIRRHLCALPFAVLLENIAGVMAPLERGATCIVLPLAEVGLAGSSNFDAARFQATVVAQQPDSVILLPQMLRVWTGYLMQTAQRAPACLRMVAVGGAAVGTQLLHAARAVGIPAFEGYGLSEGASVQTLNLPGADRPGSAGRALPHARIRIAPDGEIEIAGSLFLGYLGAGDDGGPDTSGDRAWWPSGDLGRIDEDGFLHVDGRKKHVLITAFGRNVSPEWVETALRGENAIAQAVVLGDGEPALSAVLWPVRPDASDHALQSAVDAANAALPDYARIGRWQRALAGFDAASGMATSNGRPQRTAVLRMHAAALELAAPPTTH